MAEHSRAARGLSRTELSLVRFENVGLRYGLGPEVLRDLNFQIPAHSFQFLTGPSGAGKTSLLRLLFLSHRPTRGLVNLFGHDISQLGKDEIADLRKRIGIVLQDFRLLDHMTTYENVALPFRVMGRSESSYRKEVIDLLKWVGLGERMDALPPILSGGEKQRAAIARAVISRPAAAAGRRANRQRRSDARPPPAAAVHRAQQVRHRRHHRHPRYRPDGPVRGATLRAAPGTAARL
ncbi:cell division transport system ATP-binding protein [Bradyrhizobium sp. GM6.1]